MINLFCWAVQLAFMVVLLTSGSKGVISVMSTLPVAVACVLNVMKSTPYARYKRKFRRIMFSELAMMALVCMVNVVGLVSAISNMSVVATSTNSTLISRGVSLVVCLAVLGVLVYYYTYKMKSGELSETALDSIADRTTGHMERSAGRSVRRNDARAALIDAKTNRVVTKELGKTDVKRAKIESKTANSELKMLEANAKIASLSAKEAVFSKKADAKLGIGQAKMRSQVLSAANVGATVTGTLTGLASGAEVGKTVAASEMAAIQADALAKRNAALTDSKLTDEQKEQLEDSMNRVTRNGEQLTTRVIDMSKELANASFDVVKRKMQEMGRNIEGKSDEEIANEVLSYASENVLLQFPEDATNIEKATVLLGKEA